MKRLWADLGRPGQIAMGIVAVLLVLLGAGVLTGNDDAGEIVETTVVVSPTTTRPVLPTLTTSPPTTVPPSTAPETSAPPSAEPDVSPPDTSASSGDTFYADCAAAEEAGVAPLYPGDPGYRSGLDNDSDDVACETD